MSHKHLVRWALDHARQDDQIVLLARQDRDAIAQRRLIREMFHDSKAHTIHVFKGHGRRHS